MKRIVSLVLALSMVLSMFSFAFAGTSLADVEKTDYEAAVGALVELGIVNGYEDGSYKPERTVSRAEMAKFLVVSAGLEPAADVSKGATKFSDVAANHWATGYINVATEYGYINGYPEGTFAPDATVSYAEAVTMAIRVLGYKSVVEAKGTWPTNYIAKAQELKVLEDVKYGKYNDGATRGNVALLMWNMLTTAMWDVTGENESNGLNFSNANGVTMIDKYFEDYAYLDEKYEFVVTGFDFSELGKVKVTLESETGIVVGETTTKRIPSVELAEDIDFTELFGRTVSVLFNVEEEVAVMVIPSNKDKVVEGYVDDLSGDKYTFASGEAETIFGAASGESSYSVNVIKSKKEAEYTTYFDGSNSVVVKEIKAAKNNTVKVYTLNGTSVDPIDAEAIVLIDGEWATANDLEAGDVLTELVADKVFVASRNVATGSFDEVTLQKGSEDVFYIKVDGERYDRVANSTPVVEIDEDGEDIPGGYILTEVHLADKEDDASKYFGEEATLYLNFLDEVIRIEFEEVADKEATGHFYVVTNGEITWPVQSKTGTTYYVELNGESYEIKKGYTLPEVKSGDVVLATFDSSDRVKEMFVVGKVNTTVPNDGEDYYFDTVVSGDNEEILDKNNYLSGDKKYKVTSSTTVYTITGVKDEDNENVITGYTVELSKGTEALEGATEALVATESGDTFNKAAYVFVWEEAKNTEKTFGLVEDYIVSSSADAKKYLVIDGTKYEVDEAQAASVTEALVGTLVPFVEDEGIITLVLSMVYDVSQIASGDYVTDIEGSLIKLKNPETGLEYPFDKEAEEETYEEYKVFMVEVSEDVDTETYEFTSYEETTWAEAKLKVDDVIAMSEDGDPVDVILVIRGFDRD